MSGIDTHAHTGSSSFVAGENRITRLTFSAASSIRESPLLRLTSISIGRPSRPTRIHAMVVQVPP